MDLRDRRLQRTELRIERGEQAARCGDELAGELRVVRTERDLLKEQLNRFKRQLFDAKGEVSAAHQKDTQTAEFVADLLLMREHHMSLAGAQQDFDPLSRETLRIALIVGSIDELVKNLQMPHGSH